MVFVTKVDGSRQPFYKERVMRTCMRMDASRQIARQVADKVASKVYDGIPTKKVLKMIFQFMKEYRPETKYKIDLREAISLLRPKPDFEMFVAELLKADGYEVITNKIAMGRCIDHEIDVIAKKGKEVIYVEVKHHYQPHTYTGMGKFLIINSAFEDMVDGFKAGKNKIKFNKAMLVCNTKISEHARKYAECRGILHIGWNNPTGDGLVTIIGKKSLYPITFLKDLDKNTQNRLGDNGIVLLKQLIETDLRELMKRTGLPRKKLEDLVRKSQEVLKTDFSQE